AELECDNVLLVDVLWNGLAAISSIAEISNKVADQLTKMDEDRINCLVTLEDPPLSMRDLLEKDMYNSSMDE
ncbi:hypothetical protein Goari_011224, partial [Gossypium aridum]|nr:hypothetical protein [Gossypium aridum]